ncbi:MAG: class I SAM-dependent methyltransferase [bacterium]|nr:class I SAM-dependent methyltransferase [bacterium]
MFDRIALIKSKLACPVCHGDIFESESVWSCQTCRKEFLAKDGQICFETVSLPEEQKNLNKVRDWFKQWPKFYYFILDFFGPVWWGGLDPQTFLKRFPAVGTTVDLGSGPSRVAEEIINVDLFSYPSVDIVSGITNLPFKNDSIQRIICDNVLEHISEPEAALAEMRRVLAPGGVAYICLPFLAPFHASPYDYTRWTAQGFRYLAGKHFAVVEDGVVSGIFSTLTTWLCYLLASLFSFGNVTLYWLLVNFSTLIFFPIKFLDIIANHLPFARDTAAVLYFVLKKNN